MKKIFAKLHLWLSIPFGIIISLLCISGAVLVFETEFQEMAKPGLYFAKEVTEAAIPLEELIPSVQKQLPDSTVISSVSISSDPKRNYRFAVAGQGRTSYLVDPYAGEVRGKVNPYEKGTFFSVMRRLHRWFMFPYSRGEFSWGKMITGVSTLMLFFILITGIVIWVPKTLKMLKRRLSIKVNKGNFRFWYDLHLAGGMYTALFLILFCLTGLTWSFGWYRDAVYKMFGAETTVATAHAPEAREGSGRPERVQGEGGERRGGGGNRGGRGEGRVNYAVWTDVVAKLAEENPRFKTITVQSGAATVANNRTGNTRASDRYEFHPRTGEITGVQLYKDSPRSTQLRGWLFALHVGSFGGMFTKILSFVACLIGAALPLTGYYFYIKKLLLKRKSRRKKLV